jgi:truncated hemoglobin YjbI
MHDEVDRESGTEDAEPRRRGPLAPNARMWEALDRGRLLREILIAFYAEVFDDERLAPFFRATTREWVTDHQYAFLADVFTGEKTFFGDRPRNAHHWMVISDELFDHREAIMERTLRAHGLPDDLVRAWLAVEEVFRSHIVKDAPFPRMRNGVAMPLEGYERIALDAGGACDDCGAEIARGAAAAYHVRTGQAFCAPCADARGAS